MNSGTSKLQRWSAELYSQKARFVGDLAFEAVALLQPQHGERILDVGCGDGYLTEKIMASGATVIGFDFSPELVHAARSRGISTHLGNAEALDFEQEFDGVFSNAALHWMRQADAVVSGVNRALKAGGRFVGEFAGARNAYHIRNAIHNALTDRGIDFIEIDPWYLPTAEEYALALQNGGLSVIKIELFDRPIVIDYSIEDWITIFGSPYLTILPEKARGEFLKEVSETLRPHLLTKDGFWTVDYTRIRFRAEKPK